MKEFWESIKMAYTDGGIFPWVATIVVIAAIAAAIWVLRDEN
jgi:hypothetical protein